MGYVQDKGNKRMLQHWTTKPAVGFAATRHSFLALLPSSAVERSTIRTAVQPRVEQNVRPTDRALPRPAQELFASAGVAVGCVHNKLRRQSCPAATATTWRR